MSARFFSFWYASFTYVSKLLLRLDQKRTKTTPALHTSDHSAEVNPVIESIENARHEAVVALLTTTVCFALNSTHHHGNEQNGGNGMYLSQTGNVHQQNQVAVIDF